MDRQLLADAGPLARQLVVALLAGRAFSDSWWIEEREGLNVISWSEVADSADGDLLSLIARIGADRASVAQAIRRVRVPSEPCSYRPEHHCYVSVMPDQGENDPLTNLVMHVARLCAPSRDLFVWCEGFHAMGIDLAPAVVEALALRVEEGDLDPEIEATQMLLAQHEDDVAAVEVALLEEFSGDLPAWMMVRDQIDSPALHYSDPARGDCFNPGWREAWAHSGNDDDPPGIERRRDPGTLVRRILEGGSPLIEWSDGADDSELLAGVLSLAYSFQDGDPWSKVSRIWSTDGVMRATDRRNLLEVEARSGDRLPDLDLRHEHHANLCEFLHRRRGQVRTGHRYDGSQVVAVQYEHSDILIERNEALVLVPQPQTHPIGQPPAAQRIRDVEADTEARLRVDWPKLRQAIWTLGSELTTTVALCQPAPEGERPGRLRITFAPQTDDKVGVRLSTDSATSKEIVMGRRSASWVWTSMAAAEPVTIDLVGLVAWGEHLNPKRLDLELRRGSRGGRFFVLEAVTPGYHHTAVLIADRRSAESARLARAHTKTRS